MNYCYYSVILIKIALSMATPNVAMLNAILIKITNTVDSILPFSVQL